MRVPTHSVKGDKSGLLLSLFCWLLSSAAFAQTIINFDDVSDKTDIRTHYQSRGVSFSCDGTACADPSIANGIYARASTFTASLPNTVAPVKDGAPGVRDQFTGRVIATFSNPVKTVAIDAKTVLVPEPLNQLAYANMIALDVNGNVVGSAIGSQLNSFQTLTVRTSSNQISKVSLGTSGNVAVALCDNLRFDSDPSALWLIVLVLFITVVVVWVYKRKRDLPRPPPIHLFLPE